jgi:hypothetical protein
MEVAVGSREDDVGCVCSARREATSASETGTAAAMTVAVSEISVVAMEASFMLLAARKDLL